MLRWFYIWLLKLHPTPFRQRFGDEMLDIFDRAGSRVRLIGDAMLSLMRQWALRPEYRVSAEVAMFRTIHDYRPRPIALVNGGLLTVAIAVGLIAAINHSGRPLAFLIGVHYPSPHLLTVSRESVAESDLNTTIKFGKEPENPWKAIAAVYFRFIRVLGALDADRDLEISSWEMFTAPAALRRLDLDHDGKLSPEECGFFLGGSEQLPADMVARARLTFMRENPVLAALDTNHDGEISAEEIANSAAALKKLDQNGDRRLTPDELIPDQLGAQSAMIIMQLDANRDGYLSRAEWENESGELRELLESADRDHDGVVTRRELNDELRLRREGKRVLEGAQRSAGVK
jgi:Ca2+-binding EF-hand superfamily protein